MCSDIKYRNYLRECPGLNERPLRMSPLFTAEKCNEHPGLMTINEILCFTFCLVWKMILFITYFAFFNECPSLNEHPFWKVEN